MKKQIIFCAVLAGTLALNLSAADEEKKPAAKAAPQQRIETVAVEAVREIDESAARKYVGQLEAVEEVELLARVSGNITSVKFKEGDLVKPGQLLFELEDTTYRAKAQAAKAVCDQIKAELKYAESNYERQKGLYDKSATSKSTWEDAERLYFLTKAKYEAAAAELMDAENNLSYTKITSPIAGRIGKMTYTQGNYVTISSNTLADIVQIAPIYATFAISERDFLTLFGDVETMKEKANIRLLLADGSTEVGAGKVALVDNKVDSDTGTMMVWAVFENQDHKLIPGGLVTVELSRKTEKKFPAIRLSGLLTDQAGSYVLVVGGEGKVERRPVELGSMVGDFQLILKGLKPGETVIVDGTHKARPGAVVKTVPLQ